MNKRLKNLFNNSLQNEPLKEKEESAKEKKEERTLEAGLYIVATPIGNLEDITLRALRVLRTCDRILCEDSRVTIRLLNHYQIKKPLILYHDHNSDKIRPEVIALLQQGKSLALVSDAGTPLICDPGYKLVQECLGCHIKITTVPGPTAFVSAGILSGFPLSTITFLGFWSHLSRADLQYWAGTKGTLIGFEAPHKMQRTLGTLANLMKNRKVAVVKEITKIFESTLTGDFQTLIDHFSEQAPRGEIAIVLSPPLNLEEDQIQEQERVTLWLQQNLEHCSVRDAVQQVAPSTSLKKKQLYDMALALASKKL